MNFLNDLLAAWGNGQTPFAQDQMQTMQGGGMPIPDFVNAPPQGLPSMVGSMPRTPMPLQKPMLAGSGNSEGMSRRPPAAVVSGPEPVSADLAAPSFATTLSGALQGASEATGPLGALLGGIGGAIGANDAVTEKNQTFRLLKARGLSDVDAALAIKNPQYMQQLLTVLARKEAPMSEADQLELEKKRLEIEALRNARPNLTKDAPTGTMWVDPNDQSKGVKPIPGVESKATPGETALDKAYAKSYEADVINGGLADATKNLEALKSVQRELLDPKGANLTGPVLGRLPDFVTSVTNPEAINMRDRVEEVVQRNLRVILGAQFTNEEGKRLIARAYNPALDEATNAQRIGALISAMDQALQAKKASAAYFEQHGTLKGFRGKTDFSFSDFENAIGDVPAQNKNAQANSGRTRVYNPNTGALE